MKVTVLFTLFTLLCAGFLSGQGQTFDWDSARRIAEQQHEIIQAHLKRGEFQRVPAELRKIYSLRLPAKYESILREEVDLVVKYLIHQKEFETALKIIDEAVSNLTVNRHKVHLLKKKTYILDRTGRDKEAVRSLEFMKTLKPAP